MIRATTPTHIFNLPIDPSRIKALRITYKQLFNVVLEKTEKDVTFGEASVFFKMSQQETLLFQSGYDVKFQMRVLLHDGTALASSIFERTVQEILNEEVLA